MRSAPPPVELTLPEGRRERALVAALYALAAGAFVGWLVQRELLGGHSALWLAAPLLGALAGWRVLPPARGRLHWDGSSWVRQLAPGTAPTPCVVQLQWDLGVWVLLRLRGAASRRAGWCGVSKAQAGSSWHGLRLALYHQPTGDPASRGSA